MAATSLPDASRAYIGSYYIDSADNVCPQVTVIDATNFTVKTGIAIPGFPDAANPANATYYVARLRQHARARSAPWATASAS